MISNKRILTRFQEDERNREVIRRMVVPFNKYYDFRVIIIFHRTKTTSELTLERRFIAVHNDHCASSTICYYALIRRKKK